MREIGKNMDPNMVQRPEVKTASTEKTDEVKTPAAQEKEIKDFSNPTEILGRSQVSQADNVKNDANFALNNPEIVENADKYFDMAYNQLLKSSEPDAYEKACAMTKAYVDEFHC